MPEASSKTNLKPWILVCLGASLFVAWAFHSFEISVIENRRLVDLIVSVSLVFSAVLLVVMPLIALNVRRRLDDTVDGAWLQTRMDEELRIGKYLFTCFLANLVLTAILLTISSAGVIPVSVYGLYRLLEALYVFCATFSILSAIALPRFLHEIVRESVVS